MRMIALLLLCSACVADPPSERFVCSAAAPCPAGFSCVESRCVSESVDSGVTDTGADTVTDAADAGPDALVDSGEEDVGCVPSAEVCDGLDNDCDPDTPDGAEEEGGSCDLDGDGCANGMTRCEDGAPRCVGDGTSDERCNGRDDDCDGETDEADPRVGVACCAGAIVCADGELGCANRMVASSFDVCDGTDNDCDGAIDEFEPCECETVRNDFGTYLFCDEAPSAVVANNLCVGRGYHAVVIDGPDEQAVLSDLAIARGRSYLIGLTSALSGSFRWINGSDATYRGWAEGQPGEEQCTFLSVDAEGRWVTGSCTAPAAYICEADGVPWTPPLVE